MSKKVTADQINPQQSAAFIEKARELEADGDESKADLLMNRLAKMKPEPRKAKAPEPVKTGPGRSRSGVRSPN